MSIVAYEGEGFEVTFAVIVAGGGACGLCAGIAAADAGADVLVIERDPVPLGTTAMSSGLIPAAGTRAQRSAGVADDNAELHAADLIAKTGGLLEPERALNIARESSVTVDWLDEQHGLPLDLVTSAASLPGHSRPRLHGTPNRSGAELMAALQEAAAAAGVIVLPEARVSAPIVDETNRVRGVEVIRPDGSVERIGCGALVLATCGYAGNPELVARHIPEIRSATAHTHPASQGDALAWGQAMGAAAGDLGSYQGHANLVAGHGLLLHWIVVSEGGIQVNLDGERFADEGRGYSEQAVDVIAQREQVAWTVFDHRIDALMREFCEYRDIEGAGALWRAEDISELAHVTRIPAARLEQTLLEVDRMALGQGQDRFGRRFSPSRRLRPPYVAVKVTGALFHTQGGLKIDGWGRVLQENGLPLPNLLAGGGAARGVSGPAASGYLAGNGLMSATTYGRIAGTTAARIAAGKLEG